MSNRKEASIAHMPADGSLIESPKFTCFPRLPKELRLQIFESVHEISNPSQYIMFDPIATCKFCQKSLDDSRKIPSLLHVNQESRTHFLKVYIAIKYHPSQNPIYFNKVRDTLILRREDSTFHYFPLRTYPVELFPQVQNIVVASTYPPHKLGTKELCRYFSSFPLLDIRKLTFIFEKAEDPPHCHIQHAGGGTLEKIFENHGRAVPKIGYMALENWQEETGWREKCCCLWWCQEPSFELLDSLWVGGFCESVGEEDSEKMVEDSSELEETEERSAD